MNNFITNNTESNLKARIKQLINQSNELKFLIGFFYFSGTRELYEELKRNEQVTIKILVGLNVDIYNEQFIEVAYSSKSTDEEKIQDFYQNIKKSINSDYFDNKEFYEQILFFIELIKSNRLLIRKTYEPNHSKLYLFILDDKQVGRNKLFITGSSNLTKAGLITQNEFNVEISDYGFEKAEAYFDELWENAVKINELEEVKQKLVTILEQETLVKQITPFEAYCLVLKSYLNTYEHSNISTFVIELLEKNGYKSYRYQLDAIKQATAIINKYNGVLIADVVGLGKTIIACATAKLLRKRGIVICPPGLMGDDNKTEGWYKYLDQFQMNDWVVRSIGELEKTLRFVQQHNDIEVIIIDEAHRFRNQDTKSYEFLKNICRGKKVILLSATPFNNKPYDILSLLSLFMAPKNSPISLNKNLENYFAWFESLFEKLAYIKKYHNSNDNKRKEKAKYYYESIFNSNIIKLANITRKTHFLAKQIREVIEPVTIRRNRLDLKKNPLYKDEVKELSIVENPQEWFFELTSEQLNFYDEVISVFFAPPDKDGKFKGAIYRPFEYEQGIANNEENKKIKPDKEANRELIQQRNLFDIMRRLLVKRFESSFGAFQQSINNFIRITENVLAFIEKTGNGDPKKGEYILDRSLLEELLEEIDEEQVEKKLVEYEEQIAAGVYPKKHKRYKIEKFALKNEFIEDIQSDLELFRKINQRIEELKLVANDPKAECLFRNIEKELNKPPQKGEPKRKVIIFSEYADTIHHIENRLKELNPLLQQRTLVVTGAIPDSKISVINQNFDASANVQVDNFDVLLCTDKLSEGFNLNRAGMVVNYDIPWNPVRVIQRLGRINRISKKVFNSLYIVNFFPTEKGSEYVRSREIAQNKMFMIHNTLGEDAKIFDIDEEPSPAGLYQKLNQNPDNNDVESFYTKINNLFQSISEKYPDTIKKLDDLPKRIKVSKPFTDNEMLVFIKKNRLYVKAIKKVNGKIEIYECSFEDVLEKIACEPNTPSIAIDEEFWMLYEKVKDVRKEAKQLKSGLSTEQKALNNLDAILRGNHGEHILELKPFLCMLREDILDYGTLPEYTLRRLAQLKLSDIKTVSEEIKSICNEIGENYLEKEKKKQEGTKEIIIAINNVDNRINENSSIRGNKEF